MSTKRTRFSQPPFRHKNETPRGPSDEAPLPKAAWSQQPNDTAWGMHPSELWGVSSGKPNRKRGEKSCARRRDKAAAKRKGITLKSYIRSKK